MTPMVARIRARLEEAGGLVPTQELRQAAGARSYASFRVHISTLRRDLPKGVTLVNEYGKGYRLHIKRKRK